jgi:hypothetical protein
MLTVIPHHRSNGHRNRRDCLASPAPADSNDEQFIQAISDDGIVMDRNAAILQGHSENEGRTTDRHSNCDRDGGWVPPRRVRTVCRHARKIPASSTRKPRRLSSSSKKRSRSAPMRLRKPCCNSSTSHCLASPSKLLARTSWPITRPAASMALLMPHRGPGSTEQLVHVHL